MDNSNIVQQVQQLMTSSSEHNYSRSMSFSMMATDALHEEPMKVTFLEQPPKEVRKGHLFGFALMFFEKNETPVEVTLGEYLGFPDEQLPHLIDTSDQGRKDGLLYRVQFKLNNGFETSRVLFICMSDSETGESIRYEGQHRNPDARHVLLTHETTCNRCISKKPCGNRHSTPANCEITAKFAARFFMRCNQNCIKRAGNPQNKARNFRVAVYTNFNRDPVAFSDKVFVHNNSTKGKKPFPTIGPLVVHQPGSQPNNLLGKRGPAIIKAVIPSEGWSTGGTNIVLIGENFYQGLQILFGLTLIWDVQVFSATALRVVLPPSPRAGIVEIYPANGKSVFNGHPGFFLYHSLDVPGMDVGFQRLGRLLPRLPGDPEIVPREVLLKRAGDLLEAMYTQVAYQTQLAVCEHLTKKEYDG